MKIGLKRMLVIIVGYLLALLVVWVYDTFLARVKEQILFVFMLASLSSALFMGFANCHYDLKKIWIPLIFAPGSILFLYVLMAGEAHDSRELGLFAAGLLAPTIFGVLAGCGLRKIMR